ncbi:MAG: ribosome-associated translation inhibitor RaiA [Rhodospirillales bacterium]
MQLTVTGKQMDVGDAFREHIDEKLNHILEKYFGNAIDVSVTVAREASGYRTTISAHVGKHVEVFADGAGHEPYPAFDSAAEHLAKRLRRNKRRLRDHHKGPLESLAAPAYVLHPGQDEADDEETPESAGSLDEAPPVVAELTAQISVLTVSQAVMRLDLMQEPALMFKNSAHGGLNMVYRRHDGTIGWIDPQNITRT